MRIGIGYDVHRFADPGLGRPLKLGGVHFEGSNGLEGHSDADVVLHAIMDAILGAAALGDIGDHFPPGEPAWLDADSSDLLAAVRGLIHPKFHIHNVDVTVVAESPKIGPRRQAMREQIAKLLGVNTDVASVKATTNEQLGSIGRGEGIAAIAVVLLEEDEA